MNRKTFLLAAAAAMTTAAQALPDRMTAKIPFPFEVNGIQMAAGRYEVKAGPAGKNLILRNEANGTAILTGVTGQDRDARDQAVFEFRKYGAAHFLSAVKYRGQNVKLLFAPAKREREMARTARAETIETTAE
jgi:hypothetical protein